jgi:hypothetical protein
MSMRMNHLVLAVVLAIPTLVTDALFFGNRAAQAYVYRPHVLQWSPRVAGPAINATRRLSVGANADVQPQLSVRPVHNPSIALPVTPRP